MPLLTPRRAGRARLAIAALLLVALAAGPAHASGPTSYLDVSPGSTHASAIQRLTDANILHGTSSGHFRPHDPLTRGQVATILDRLLALPATPATSAFDDIAHSVHRDAIERAHRAGVVAGTSTTTFAPSRPITRAHLATMLVRIDDRALRRLQAPVPDLDEALRTALLRAHPDLAGHPRSEELRHAVLRGYLTGTRDGRLHPDAPITRAQAASLINAFDHAANGWPPTPVTRTTAASPPASLGELRLQDRVTERDITVYFDQDYEIGQFVNGDYYVLGSPTVTRITPQWDGVKNGAMVNPATGDAHGYHAKVFGYQSSLNLAANLPAQLHPRDSLIASTGWAVGDPGAPPATASMPDAPRPSLRQAMVLTVLAEAPASDAFRPPYSPGWKPEFRLGDVDRSLLPTLTAPTSSQPRSWQQLESRTRYVWLDHKAMWTGRYLHPSDNMSDYGRDLAADINEAILALALDSPIADKETTLINSLQIGIDFAGVVKNAKESMSGYYGDFGGTLGVGRKWPTLFAAHLLDSDEILAVLDSGPRFWQEDGQTYASQGGAADPWRTEGDGTWGERAWTTTDFNRGRPGNTAYRHISSIAWGSAVLGAIVYDLVEEWDHAPLFDYTDWYMDEERSRGDVHRNYPAGRSGGFHEDMWDIHRPNFTVSASNSGYERR